MKKHEFIRQISDSFQQFYKDRYITHRDGNACLKLDNGLDREVSYFVTASGIDKTYMSIDSFIEVNSQSKIIPSSTLDTYDLRKPSIETQAHISALESTGKQVSIHVHSPKTVALFEVYDNLHSKRMHNGLYKAYTTAVLENEIKTQWPELFRYTKLGKTVPFLDPGSKELHESIAESFLIDKPDIIVLQRHGVLSVGKDIQEAMEHIVRLEHISSILLDIERAK